MEYAARAEGRSMVDVRGGAVGGRRPAVRFGLLASCVVATVATATGCGTNSSSAAPPLKVCGQVLYSGPAGAVIEDASSAPMSTPLEN